MLPSSPDPVDRLLDFLQAEQRDGSFAALVSADGRAFAGAEPISTTFATSLVAGCLRACPDPRAVLIGRKAADWLVSQLGPSFTANYWQRDSAEARSRPYPDDLDDTACAWMAIRHFTPDAITGSWLAALVRTLASQEVAVGGPYRTWIGVTGKEWQGVDAVVNANVAACLRDHGVALEPLNAHLRQAATNPALGSDFYPSPFAREYFLSRAVPDAPMLHGLPVPASLLEEAMRVCTLARIGDDRVTRAGAELYRKLDAAPLLACPLWVDRIEDGTPVCAGSAALTAAFCLEALCLVRTQPVPPKAPDSPLRQTVASLLENSTASLIPELRQPLQAACARVMKIDAVTPICSLAEVAADAFGCSVSNGLLSTLGTATAWGWIAYTLLDDALDGGPTAPLPAATWATRQMHRFFSQAVPDSPLFAADLERILARIDEANAWEAAHCRIPALPARIRLPVTELPDYGDYANLANRSIGHCLAALAILRATGRHEDTAPLERFFFHFLLARQLNDDAHDWEPDLRAGLLNPVGCQLVRATGTPIWRGQREPLILELRRLFLGQELLVVCDQVDSHLEQARTALAACRTLRHPERLLDLLKPVHASTNEARREHARTAEFLSSYQGQS